MKINLTVFFEDPFWVGIFEKSYANQYEVCKVVFGSEPKDYEVYDFVLKSFYKLKFSTPFNIEDAHKNANKKINPKRLQRKIKSATKDNGIGTKAQIAMKQQYEKFKICAKKTSREKREEEKERRFKLRQQKKLMKHKGH